MVGWVWDLLGHTPTEYEYSRVCTALREEGPGGKYYIQSLGWEDSLEKERAMHSSTLAWDIPWAEVPGLLWYIGLPRIRHD